MGFFAEGSSEPGGSGAWNNMGPLKKDFSKDFGDARQLYADAFNTSKAWAPNAKAATVAPTAFDHTDAAARAYQDKNAQMLADIAAGKGGGVAGAAYAKGLGNAQAANNAAALSRTHGNALAGSMRTLGNTNQGMAVGGEARLQALKAQEQLSADAALNQQLGSMRGQDLSLASEAARMEAARRAANAGFANQTGIENQFAGLAHDAWKQKALGAGADFDRTMWENMIAEKRAALGMDINDTGREWRSQQQQDLGRGYTLDTMGSLYGDAFTNRGGWGKY
jgi:hypothetical protein